VASLRWKYNRSSMAPGAPPGATGQHERPQRPGRLPWALPWPPSHLEQSLNSSLASSPSCAQPCPAPRQNERPHQPAELRWVLTCPPQLAQLFLRLRRLQVSLAPRNTHIVQLQTVGFDPKLPNILTRLKEERLTDELAHQTLGHLLESIIERGSREEMKPGRGSCLLQSLAPQAAL
jgi:hypothetical protein